MEREKQTERQKKIAKRAKTTKHWVRTAKAAGVVLVVGACVFGASMTSEANRIRLVETISGVRNSGDVTWTDNGENRDDSESNFEQAKTEIVEKIHIAVPEFYYIPEGTTEKAIAGRQPKVSFYTNYSYLIAGSLLYRDQRTMSELASAAIGQSTLLAKGATEDQAVAFLQPIVIDTHPLNNPWLNYSVYLCNTLFPGILMLLIFLITAYTIGVEIKENTAKELLHLADNSIVTALVGKLLPQTILFFIIAVFYNVYLYGFLHYPCNSGIFPMLLSGLLLVLASQAVGLFFFGLFGTLRLALSAASLWGVLSFSISGFTFPVMAMHPTLQALSVLFPLRHYFLLYANLALNGYPLIYAWHSVVALLIFMLLPFFVLKKLRTIMLHYTYIP